MRITKLLSDWMLLELEPEKRFTRGGLVLPDNVKGYVRVGKVIMTGIGRQHKDRFVPMDPDILGKRVAFFVAAMSGHRQGQALKSYLDSDKGLIRQEDVLAVIEGNVLIE
jgi:co-chaperonin GroES (HSP10)